MSILAKTLAAITGSMLVATGALAQGAASLVVPIGNEPAPRLFVESPLPGPLAQGRRLHPVPGGEFAHHVLTAQTVTFTSQANRVVHDQHTRVSAMTPKGTLEILIASHVACGPHQRSPNHDASSRSP